MKFNLIFAMGCFVSVTAFADSCDDVISELQAMKKAQSSIQESLIANHGLFAGSMESYADALSSTGGRVHKTVSSNMLESAQAIRERAQKAQNTAQKLDSATTKLIQQITSCLK